MSFGPVRFDLDAQGLAFRAYGDPGHPAPTDSRWCPTTTPPLHPGLYICWDGYWYRRMRWDGRRWRHVRGWPGTWPPPLLWWPVEGR